MKFENRAFAGIRLVSDDLVYEIGGHINMAAIELTTYNKNAGTGTEEFFTDTVQVGTLLKRFPSLKDFMPFIFRELDYVKLAKEHYQRGMSCIACNKRFDNYDSGALHFEKGKICSVCAKWVQTNYKER